MKTSLALIIAALLFLLTPMVASADVWRVHNGTYIYNGWVRDDYYNYGSFNNRFDNHCNSRYENRHHHRTKNHLRRELRETRRELRQIKRQIRRNQRRSYYARPYFTDPVIVVGMPQLVFQFEW